MMMGGGIVVESPTNCNLWTDDRDLLDETFAAGAGSTFSFTSCFALQDTAEITSIPTREVDFQGLPVLIVDRSPANRRVLGLMLREWGMKPTSMSGDIKFWRRSLNRQAAEIRSS